MRYWECHIFLPKFLFLILILSLLLQKWGYVYAWWGSNTLHWYDWSDNTWASVYQKGFWCCSKNWLANWSLWTFCSTGLFVGSRSKPFYIFSFKYNALFIIFPFLVKQGTIWKVIINQEPYDWKNYMHIYNISTSIGQSLLFLSRLDSTHFSLVG